MATNPEEAALEDNHRFGIFDEDREKRFEENYGRKAGVRAGGVHND